ncbi:hypothetical protein Vadar_030695 [Vaccinium darrowii]|uniref:Uncharacterized protein n=1 Tax=Vaccinium darrowii TaxID=229202 RepID=A0ACB7YIE2_9ERIC|nr:hypothetical protein Vadar_030695 [Vaccinium darrowii]
MIKVGHGEQPSEWEKKFKTRIPELVFGSLLFRAPKQRQLLVFSHSSPLPPPPPVLSLPLTPSVSSVLASNRHDCRRSRRHQHCEHYSVRLRSASLRLLWHGHQVMYNQLASWIVDGLLNDQYGEFFISRSSSLKRRSMFCHFL